MKKVFIVLLIGIMAASMSGCGLAAMVAAKAEGKECTMMELPEFTTRPREEIESTGIEAADVLGLLDEITLQRTQFFYGKAEALVADRVETQFVSITPSNLSLYDTSGYFLERNFQCYFIERFYRNWEEYTKEYFGDALAPHQTIGNAYVVDIAYWEEVDGVAAKEELKDWGIAQREFEAVLQAFGSAASEAMTIDRELIEGATEEQLWCLYDMAETIYMINMEGRLPEDTPNIIVTENDGEVREYSCYMEPLRYVYYGEDGNTILQEKKFTYDADGDLTKYYEMYKYEENGVRETVIEQVFDENGCILEQTRYQIENGVVTFRHVVTYAPGQQIEKYADYTPDVWSRYQYVKEMIYGKDDVFQEYSIPEYDENGYLEVINYYDAQGELTFYYSGGQYHYPD